jgi:signal transduction histidine kinase
VLALVASSAMTVRLELERRDMGEQVALAATTLNTGEELETWVRFFSTSIDAHLGHGPEWQRAQVGQALPRIEPTLQRLGELVRAGGDPGQIDRFDRLAPTIRDLVARSHDALDAHERGDEEQVRSLSDAIGLDAVTAADGLLNELELVEQQRLADRHAAWRASSARGTAFATAAAAFLLVLMVLAGRVVAREVEARERLSAQRAELLELQQQLMAVVGHDLRNPLAAMKSAAALIARDPDAHADHREDARRIVGSARRMERLIRDLLDFSRVQAGIGLPLRPGRADLDEVLRRALEDLGRDAAGRVEVERRGDLTGWLDADRLEQLAANLLANALKYGPPKRPVRVLLDGTRGDLVVQVHDDGGGIPAGQRESIFEPFRRGRGGDPEAAQSLGLGLFIVRRIAEAHGGDVQVASAPGEGTTFTVRLPRGAPPEAPAATPPPI